MRALTDATGGQHESAFVDDERDERDGHDDTLLRRFQRDVLDGRSPLEVREVYTDRPLRANDDSVRVLSCPGVRRELEVVASEICGDASRGPAQAR